MPRQMFMDELWLKFKAIMLKVGIYDKPFLRQTIEGIFYRLRVGCPWRDLPDVFGHWNAVYKRFNEWSRKEKLKSMTMIPPIYQTVLPYRMVFMTLD